MTCTITFNDNCPTVIYPIVMHFAGQSLDTIQTRDVATICQERADALGIEPSTLMNEFTRYVSKCCTRPSEALTDDEMDDYLLRVSQRKNTSQAPL